MRVCVECIYNNDCIYILLALNNKYQFFPHLGTNLTRERARKTCTKVHRMENRLFPKIDSFSNRRDRHLDGFFSVPK